jgi:hypothetical protein
VVLFVAVVAEVGEIEVEQEAVQKLIGDYQMQ